MDKPHPPLHTWPIHVADEEGGFYLWWVEPATVVVQMHAKVFNLTTSRRLVEVVNRVLDHHRENIHAVGGARFVHDWRLVEGLESSARQYLGDAWRKNLKRGDVKSVHTSLPLNPFSKMAFQVVNVAATLTTGVSMNHVSPKDFDATLTKLEVRRPDEKPDLPADLLAK